MSGNLLKGGAAWMVGIPVCLSMSWPVIDVWEWYLHSDVSGDFRMESIHKDCIDGGSLLSICHSGNIYIVGDSLVE